MKGIGVDIVDLRRIDIHNIKFIQSILSEDEWIQFNQLKTDIRKREFIGGRFAGKEAYLKAHRLGLGGKSFKEISILNREDGSPYLNDENCDISLSHEKDYVVAFVIKYE